MVQVIRTSVLKDPEVRSYRGEKSVTFWVLPTTNYILGEGIHTDLNATAPTATRRLGSCVLVEKKKGVSIS